MKCVVTSKCIFCGCCEPACPIGCIIADEDEELMIIDENRCVGCGRCADLCPIGAISKKG